MVGITYLTSCISFKILKYSTKCCRLRILFNCLLTPSNITWYSSNFFDNFSWNWSIFAVSNSMTPCVSRHCANADLIGDDIPLPSISSFKKKKKKHLFRIVNPNKNKHASHLGFNIANACCIFAYGIFAFVQIFDVRAHFTIYSFNHTLCNIAHFSKR